MTHAAVPRGIGRIQQTGPRDWPLVKLEDCVDLIAGFPFKSGRFLEGPTGGVPLVKGENVSQGRILWSISKYWPQNEFSAYSRVHLRPGDVVLAMDRPWVPAGLKWAVIRDGDPQALLVQRCARLRSKVSALDQGFLRFLIGSPFFEDFIQPITTGVNVPHISGGQILSFQFSLPPLTAQHRIAGILSAYDDLIENCERRIRVLDEMAHALYREWFVNFRYLGHEQVPLVDSPLGPVPRGWHVRKLGDVIQLNYGKALKAENRRGGSVPVFASSGHVGWHDERLTEGPGIVLGRKGNVGSVFWSDIDFFVIDTAYFVTSTMPLRFVYFEIQGKNFINGDAAVPGLSRQQANALDTLVPPDDLLARFGGLVEGLLGPTSLLRKQTDNLRRTRDLLLPRLLSGQLSVDTDVESAA